MSPVGSCLPGWMRMKKVAGNHSMKAYGAYSIFPFKSSNFTHSTFSTQDQRTRAAISYQRPDESFQEGVAELYRPTGCP